MEKTHLDSVTEFSLSSKRGTSKIFRHFGNQKHKKDERGGARPPNTWDDISPGRENFAPHRHAYRLKEKGISREEALQKLCKKWKITKVEAMKIIDTMWRE